MKALITGASGAVGSELQRFLEARGWEVVTWNRREVPIDVYAAMEDFVRDVQPDVLFHLAIATESTGRENESWVVNYEWTSELAWICHVLDVQFVFTSSVMVFTNDAKGPFTLDTEPDAPEGYGYEKRMAEERVFYQNPQAVVARIGWQIGEASGSNNMVDFLEKQMQEQGQINASNKWLPACSFIKDTVQTLVDLSQEESGLYMVDSNSCWNFYEIASALNELHGKRWKVVANEDFVYDQRMLDARVDIQPLDTRLPALP